MSLTIKEALNEGLPQHAALVFNGGIWDIVGSERILLNGGFTLTQAYCTEENLKPGTIAYNDFTSQLINDDGALTGFDFERKFALLLGVETEQERITGVYTDQVLCQLYLGNTHVWIFKSGSTQYVVKQTGQTAETVLKSGSSLSIFACNQSDSSTDYYLFIARKSGTKNQIAKYSIVEDGTTTMVHDFTTFTNFSNYALARFVNLRDAGTCFVYHMGTPSGVYWTQYDLKDGIPTVTRIDFVSKATLLGKKPRSTSAKIVEFSASTDTTWLDQNADTYTKAVWSQAKTMRTIFMDVSGCNNYTGLPNNVADLSFSTNPFAGIKGLTYRELLSYVCEAAGTIAREYSFLPVLDNTDNLTFIISQTWEALHLSKGTSYILSLSQEEYYSYDAADFTVLPYNKTRWTQITPVSDLFSYDYIVGTGDVEYILANNPVVDAYITANNSGILHEFNDNTKDYQSGLYYPCTLSSHLGTLIDAGDTIAVEMADGTTRLIPIFVNTITWNGGAECVAECTGVEKFNQYDDPAFRTMLQNANGAYRIAKGSQANSSSINVKHDVNKLAGSGNIVDNLRPVTFRYNLDPDEKLHYGLIFEDLVNKYPALVQDNPDDLRKRVNYNELVPILLAEIQDLRKRVKDLETGKN